MVMLMFVSLSCESAAISLKECTNSCTCGNRDADSWHKTVLVDVVPEGRRRKKFVLFKFFNK